MKITGIEIALCSVCVTLIGIAGIIVGIGPNIEKLQTIGTTCFVVGGILSFITLMALGMSRADT